MQNQNMKMTKITITNQNALLAKKQQEKSLTNSKKPIIIIIIILMYHPSSIIHQTSSIIYHHLSSIINHLSSIIIIYHLSSIIHHQSSIIFHLSSIIYDDHHRNLPLKEPFFAFGSNLCCCPWLDCLGAPIDLQEVVEKWLAIRRREDSQGFKWCEKKGKLHETSHVFLMFFFCENWSKNSALCQAAWLCICLILAFCWPSSCGSDRSLEMDDRSKSPCCRAVLGTGMVRTVGLGWNGTEHVYLPNHQETA